LEDDNHELLEGNVEGTEENHKKFCFT